MSNYNHWLQKQENQKNPEKMEQDIKLNISHHSNLRLAKLKEPGHQVFTHTYACSACTYTKHIL